MTNNNRGGFLNPESIVKEFGLKQGMQVADFGCGAGYFTIAMAKLVGEEGNIYALDVLKTALESVRSRAKIEGLLNIRTIWANLELKGGSKLEDESMDLVLLANILFQSSKKVSIIREAKRVLKEGGKMIVIEWKARQPFGPPEDLIVDKDLIKEKIEKEGFVFSKEIPAGHNHWGLVFIKS